MSTTPNMNLVLPTVGKNGTAGPDWATYLDTALTKVDSHDHTSTNGVKVPTAGLNINADLSMASFSLSSLKSAGLSNNTSSITTTTTAYAKNGELYFVDAAGNQVQITSGGSINVASLGTIGGDFSTSTATVTYSSTSKGFTFKQDSTKTADIAAGSYFMYENVASANYVKLKSPTSLASSYDLTFFTALPASTLPVSLSSTGALSSGQITTAQITDANVTTVKIADANVTTTKIADGNVTTAKIADGSVTQAKRASLGQQAGSSAVDRTSTSSTYSSDITSSTITSTGRPVAISLNGFMTVNMNAVLAQATVRLQRDGTTIRSWNLSFNANTAGNWVSSVPVSLLWIDTGASAASHTYSVQVAMTGTAGGAGTATAESSLDSITFEL